MAIARAVRWIRRAISPRLAISNFRMPLSQRASSNATPRDAASVFSDGYGPAAKAKKPERAKK